MLHVIKLIKFERFFMKKLSVIIFLALLYSSYVEAESVVERKSPLKLDRLICSTTDSGAAEDEFHRRQKALIEHLTQNKEEVDLIGWGIDATAAINKMDESHRLWLKQVAIDCELWSLSPLNAGSKNNDEAGCWCNNYISRLEQLNEYEEAWVRPVQ